MERWSIEEVRMMSTENTYQWLEPKPYKKFTKQLGIQGRNRMVWDLVPEVVVSERTSEEVTEDNRLPGKPHRKPLRITTLTRGVLPTGTNFHFTHCSLAPGGRCPMPSWCGSDGHKALGYRGFKMKVYGRWRMD